MKKLALFAFAVYIVVMFAAIYTPTRAQDATEDVTPAPTAEVTAVVGLPPTEPAPDENAVDANVILPYIGGGLVIAILGIIGIAGTGLLLLFRSTPAVQFVGKTIVPPLGDAGVTAYENYAKLTPQTWDDELAKPLRAEWEAFKKKLLEDVTVQIAHQTKGEVQKQLPDAVSQAIG